MLSAAEGNAKVECASGKVKRKYVEVASESDSEDECLSSAKKRKCVDLDLSSRDEVSEEELEAFVAEFVKSPNAIDKLEPKLQQIVKKCVTGGAAGVCARCGWRFGCKNCDENKCLKFVLRKTLEARRLSALIGKALWRQ